MTQPVSPMRQGVCSGPQRRRSPSMDAYRTKLKGVQPCVWAMLPSDGIVLSPFTSALTSPSLKCFNKPLPPPKRQKEGLRDNQSVTLSGSWPLIHILMPDAAGRVPHCVQAPALGPQTFEDFGSCFPLKSLGCGANSPVNPFRCNATEKREAEKFNTEDKYSFKNKPSSHDK